jgi:hypothetical protein
MSSDSVGPKYRDFYQFRASRAAHFTAATCRTPTKPRRDPAAQFWGPGPVRATKNERDERTDSALFDPVVHVVPTTSTPTTRSRLHDAVLLSTLPATIRAEISDGASAKYEPVDFTHFFSSLTFEFDLRTQDGLSEFTAWHNALSSHARSVRSLTFKHWTSWWGFGINGWKSSEDKTHFSRGTCGELTISRSLPTPTQETCSCSMEHLLAQQDASFDPQRFRAVTTIPQFVNCLRDDNDEVTRLTLVDAAKTFTKLMRKHSADLSRYHGLAGTQCLKCDMPSLYICRHPSTRKAKDEAGIAFSAETLPECTSLSRRGAFRRERRASGRGGRLEKQV